MSLHPVLITESQAKQIDLIAEKRNEKKWKSDKFSLINHTVGVFGEMVCRIYLDSSFDYNMYGRKGDGGKPDITLPSGIVAQVKTRNGYGKTLIIKKNLVDDLPDNGIVILLWRQDRYNGSIVGFLNKAEVIKYSYLDYTMVKLGKHKVPSYECDWKKFNDIDLILA